MNDITFEDTMSHPLRSALGVEEAARGYAGPWASKELLAQWRAEMLEDFKWHVRSRMERWASVGTFAGGAL